MKLNVKEKMSGRLGLILLAFIAFIALGLPDGLLGVGWPSIRDGFSQPLDALGVLLFTTTAGYLTSSFFNGKLISHMGIGGVLTASCAVTGAGLVGYTLVPSWWMMVALGFFAGLGAGAIDAGLNTYVAANFGEGLMQWLHASYGIGITLGPLIMTVGLTALQTWRFGYAIVGIFQLVLAAGFLFTLPLWKQTDNPSESQTEKRLTDYRTSYKETLSQPRVWLSLILFFLYTGTEVALGAWAYTLLTESRGIAPGVAGLWTGSYWATFTIGRVLAGLYARRMKVATLVKGSLITAIIGMGLLWWNPGNTVSLIGVGLTGFALAPIFPALVSGTSLRVGTRFAANTIGLQASTAGIGAAAVPGLMGVLAKATTLESIPVGLFILFCILFGGYLLALRLRYNPEKDLAREV